MRKLTWLLGAMLLLLSLTCCGNKVDSESIRSYLESSYYNESDASVDEIKDISQEQGNNDKEFIVSCTVKASNRYAVQTANWVITFERFENSWVGTGREMTYYETELQNGMSEEEMKDLVDLEGLYWQKEFESWLTYDVSDWYCTADLENGECEVSYLLTTDYGGFQFFRVYRTTAEWNDRSMQWFRKESNEYATSGEVVVTLDITGHYDFYINGKQHYTFDIEKDSGQYYMRNFTYYNRPYSTDRLEASFEEKQLLTELVQENLSDDNNTGIQVYIGEETPIQSMKDCSVVTATYELGEGMRGTIGIIGPKRMDYDKVIGTLKTITHQLDDLYKKKE